MDSSYVCGAEGALAPAGALLGLDASARGQQEQQQQKQASADALYLSMQSGMPIQNSTVHNPQFL
ncbi:unnamed protein product [Gongylonema pulchrum]|uniref:Uncharacterized protein n=1 Tax=Gongylonema pulchrum TaxID=637853 RepID=A0A183DC35_9BILA|nr:unnamed protein product [Gongylonema pulchrum]